MVSTVLCLNRSRIVFWSSMSVSWSTLAVASSIHKTYKEWTKMLQWCPLHYCSIGQETCGIVTYISFSQESPSKTQQLPLTNWKRLSSLSHYSVQPSWQTEGETFYALCFIHAYMYHKIRLRGTYLFFERHPLGDTAPKHPVADVPGDAHRGRGSLVPS